MSRNVKTVGISIDPELLIRIDKLAERDLSSRSRTIKLALLEYLEREEKRHGK